MPTINQLVRKGRNARKVKDEKSGAEAVSPEARGLSSCVHNDAEEAELGASKGGSCPFDEWDGGDDLYPWCRATIFRSTRLCWFAAVA